MDAVGVKCLPHGRHSMPFIRLICSAWSTMRQSPGPANSVRLKAGIVFTQMGCSVADYNSKQFKRVMSTGDYYSEDRHGPYHLYSLGDFPLRSGEVLLDTQLAYSLHGELNEARDNAILFTIMFSGTSKNMEHYIGPGLALDPAKYCIILPNQLGNGLSTSANNAVGHQAGPGFPVLSIADDVRAQYQLLTEHLGVKRLRMVTGWSMGAQQTYEWAVRYPDFVDVAVPIGGMARCSTYGKLFVDVFCQVLTSDPAWQAGEYADASNCSLGLKRLAHVFALMGFCADFYEQSRWQQLGFATHEALLTDFWEAWFAPMDPNVLLSMASKWRSGNVAAEYDNNLAAALGRVKAKTHIVGFERDLFVPLADCRADHQLISNSVLHEFPSLMGHFAMLGLWEEDFTRMNQIFLQALDQAI